MRKTFTKNNPSIASAVKYELRNAFAENVNFRSSSFNSASSVAKKAGWIGTLITVGFTTYDHTFGGKADEGLASSGNLASLTTDLAFVIAYGLAGAALAGLLAAGLAAVGIVALPL